MKQFIVTFEDDVCLRNGKTAEMQAELLRKIAEYGSMEEYSSHIAKHDAVWQAKLDNMTAEYNKISEFGARNEAELEVLRVYRVGVEKSVKASEAKVVVLEDSLRKADEKAKKMSEAICATLQAYEAE